MKKYNEFFNFNEDESPAMTDDQRTIVDEYIEKYGGVELKERGNKVQLVLDNNMITMEGLSFNWISRFIEAFGGGSVGMTDDSQMYILLDK